MRSLQTPGELFPDFDLVSMHLGWHSIKVPGMVGLSQLPTLNPDIMPGALLYAQKVTWLRGHGLPARSATIHPGDVVMYLGPLHSMIETSQAKILYKSHIYSCTCDSFLVERRFLRS